MSPNSYGLRAFVAGYVTAMLWSETDDEGEPFDKNYGEEDLAPETLVRIRRDCALFAIAVDPSACKEAKGTEAWSQAGHDFWLTRNRHGSGYWETSDWAEPMATTLTDLCKSFGEAHIYVGDDGLIYQD